ncbi:MAG TPA: tRNA (adenosine(37)-N6)-dimethylallyltransferase MiaA [Candidatus Binatia bacterium]|nr:tRNA (adenosine(37)-N6)-dimethylallyltransferase MiaA [Candidatus Binatia bacterium]
MAPTPSRRPPRASPIAVIVGPTASGKTDLALAVARRLPVEILVADSRQVYRGMDLGTAKPDAAARAAIPHHLLDLADPDEPFSVVDWVERARTLIPEVATRGRLPLVVGGTGLYVSALLDGYELPGLAPPPELRGRLVTQLEASGLPPLAARLSRVDPATAARTDLRNPRRVLRALERVEAAGAGAPAAGAAPYAGRIAILGLSRPPDVLRARIDARVAWMFSHGLLDEVRRLLDAGYDADLSPMTGHGYREAARVLAGEWDMARAIEVTARHTRQYAKRQLTWLRRDARIVWLPAGALAADDPALVERAVDLLQALLA